ncbi:MAG: FHA domain-containing protein [Pseudomonadales bacterium]
MGIVVEVSQRGGRSQEYHRFEQRQATIGRGYNCDVILPDPYVDAQHLRVVNDLEGLRLEVLSEAAFTQVHGKASHGAVQPITSGTRITLGNTQIRVLASDHPVDPVLNLSRTDRIINQLSRPWVVVLVTAAFFALTGLSVYYNTTREFELSKWLTQTLSPGIGAIAWVAISALITRVVRHQSRFLQHWLFMLAFLTASLLYRYINEILAFNLGIHNLVTVLKYVIPGLLLTLLLWFQLRTAFNQTALVRSLLAAGIAWSFVGYNFVNAYRDDDQFNPQPIYETTLLPVSLLWRTPNSTEAYLTEAEQLFEFPVEPDDENPDEEQER